MSPPHTVARAEGAEASGGETRDDLAPQTNHPQHTAAMGAIGSAAELY